MLFTDTARMAKSVYLITQTKPYEQLGSSDVRLLVLGDSTGYGTGVSDAGQRIGGLIGSDFKAVTIVNNSVNGRRLDELVKKPPVLAGSYKVVLLQMGANDILQERELPAVMTDLETLYKLIEPYTEHIVLMTSGNVGGAAAFTDTPQAEKFEQLSREYYAAFTLFTETHPNVTFVNLFDEPEIDPFVLQPETYLALDGLHPNAAGYALWYKKLHPVIEPFLNAE